MARVAFRTLGCKVNRVESDEIAARLLGSGFEVVPEDESDVIVINTCTVTGEADAKARKAVRQALKATSAPMVVVTGCLAALDADGLRVLGDRVIVEADKSAVASRIAQVLARELGSADQSVPVLRAGDAFRTRVPVKIEDGCDNFCSYCIVPHARGVPRSVPMDDILAEVQSLVEAGVRELVLTGINLGRYSDGDLVLADVISQVSAAGIPRLRLSSIEPPDLTEGLLDALATSPAFCRHLHVPLQSGSDAVLAAMGRKYTTAEYADRIGVARAALPGLTVTTDVIAGFPTETEDDHRASLSFVERIAFSKLHVFRYSQRAGTPAAELAQLPPETRARRATELREVGHRLRAEFVASRVGSRAEVLIERLQTGLAEGTTREYLRVRIPAGGLAVGDIASVMLEAGHIIGDAGDASA